MTPVDVEAVMTPEELEQFRGFVLRGVKLAGALGREDPAKRLNKLVEEAEEQTCQVYQYRSQ